MGPACYLVRFTDWERVSFGDGFQPASWPMASTCAWTTGLHGAAYSFFGLFIMLVTNLIMEGNLITSGSFLGGRDKRGFSLKSVEGDGVNKGEIYRYLNKPWHEEELKITLRNAIETYRLREKNKRLTEKLEKTNEQLEFLLRQQLIS